MLALPINNTLPFAESILCWCLANYAFGSDPVRPNQGSRQIPGRTIDRRWFASIALRSIVSALLLAAASGFTSMSIYIAAAIVAGALILPIVRASFIPLRSLAEFELGANGIAVLLLWRICISFSAQTAFSWPSQINANQLAALSIGFAVFIYMIHGGDLFVRGILEKSGGLPVLDESEGGAETYNHGKVIGQIERVIVVLIVMAGNLQALAFFFAAKGLIRSKELDRRPMADYFLLGSLSSFLLGLAGGLLLQRTITWLWK